MDRRKFLIGTAGTALGGSAILGSGAFSRVESHRDVTIQVAEDPDAYLGLDGTGSKNSNNYVEIDEHGHLAIDISGDEDNEDLGEGVNSDSFTWFDSMVEVCNQGKEGVGFYIEEPGDDDFPEGIDAKDEDGNARLQFYTGSAAGSQGDDGTESVMGEDNAVDIPLGECVELGVRTVTKGVDATEEDTLFGDEITLIADVDVAGDLGRQEFPIRNARTREGYGTIQDAVDDAEAGDTIEVLTGEEFEESVTIGTPGVTLKATSNSKPVIEAPDGEKAIETSANDITVDGFEVQGADGENTVEVKTGDIDTGTFTLTGSIVESAADGINTVLIAGDAAGFQGPAEVVIEDSVLVDNSGIAALNVFSGGTQASVEVTESELSGDPGGLRDIDDLTFTDNDVVLTTEAALDFEGIGDSTIEDNKFDATDEEADTFVQDDDGSLDLDDVLADNDFDPDAEVDGNQIVVLVEEEIVVEDGDEDALLAALEQAEEGDTIRVKEGEYDLGGDTLLIDTDNLTVIFEGGVNVIGAVLVTGEGSSLLGGG